MIDIGMKLVILSLLGEAIVETIEWLITREFLRQRIEALLACEVLAFVVGANIFAIAGLVVEGPLAPAAPIVGTFLAGLLMTRGSTWLHDLLSKLQPQKPGDTQLTPAKLSVPPDR